MDLGGWLRGLGLDRYEAAFRANAIDADVLCDLTDQDLERLGVLLGHRRKLLRAIAALDDTTAPQVVPSPSARELEPTVATLETDSEGPAYRERGHVTGMFCSLVDSSGSSPDRDTEVWRGLVGSFLQAASIAVTEWDGKVAEKLNDGLIAHFGSSTQENDDLERAINAARVIQRSVAELNRVGDNGKPAVAVRIVIETGPTTVDRVDSSGKLSNSAMRPQVVAEPISPIFVQPNRCNSGHLKAVGQMARKNLTEAVVARQKAPVKGKQKDYFDAVVPGLVLRVNYGGVKVWRVRHYLKRTDKDGKRVTIPTTHKLGRYPILKVKEA
jgi:class 3 adenylate cyclase